jgi:hypothetical protein
MGIHMKGFKKDNEPADAGPGFGERAYFLYLKIQVDAPSARITDEEDPRSFALRNSR